MQYDYYTLYGPVLVNMYTRSMITIHYTGQSSKPVYMQYDFYTLNGPVLVNMYTRSMISIHYRGQY